MGNKQTTFTDEQLDFYQDCTFFTRSDILRIYHRYHNLNPRIIPKDMTGSEPQVQTLAMILLKRMPEFRENPFRERILQVFSKDGQGNLTFDEFLEMFSVFNESAPREVKAHYAFKIYDFDKDSYIGKSDLGQTIELLSRNEMTSEEINFIQEQVFEEADIDGDEKLSFTEFEHVISRAPEFLLTFHLRI